MYLNIFFIFWAFLKICLVFIGPVVCIHVPGNRKILPTTSTNPLCISFLCLYEWKISQSWAIKMLSTCLIFWAFSKICLYYRWGSVVCNIHMYTRKYKILSTTTSSNLFHFSVCMNEKFLSPSWDWQYKQTAAFPYWATDLWHWITCIK